MPLTPTSRVGEVAWQAGECRRRFGDRVNDDQVLQMMSGLLADEGSSAPVAIRRVGRLRRPSTTEGDDSVVGWARTEAALPSLDVGKGDDGQTSRTAWGAKVGGVDGAGAAPAHGDDVAFSRRCCGIEASASQAMEDDGQSVQNGARRLRVLRRPSTCSDAPLAGWASTEDALPSIDDGMGADLRRWRRFGVGKIGGSARPLPPLFEQPPAPEQRQDDPCPFVVGGSSAEASYRTVASTVAGMPALEEEGGELPARAVPTPPPPRSREKAGGPRDPRRRLLDGRASAGAAA